MHIYYWTTEYESQPMVISAMHHWLALVTNVIKKAFKQAYNMETQAERKQYLLQSLPEQFHKLLFYDLF